MASRLDVATHFGERRKCAYQVNIYAQYEATVIKQQGPSPRSTWHRKEADAHRSKRESVARTVRMVRRLCQANGLDRLLTLTFDGDHATDDREVVLRRLQEFERGLREKWPDLRWLWVLERHKSGNMHVHMGVSKWLPKAAIREVWAKGFVDIRRLTSKRTGTRQTPHDTSRYLSKYIAKCADDVPKGKRRFSASHNSDYGRVECEVETREEAELIVRSLISVTFQGFVSTETSDGWRGPPIWFFRGIPICHQKQSQRRRRHHVIQSLRQSRLAVSPESSQSWVFTDRFIAPLR